MPLVPAASAREPAPDVTAGLRMEVWWLRRAEQRRVFAPRLHLGTPGVATSLHSDGLAPVTTRPWPPPRWIDSGTRRDLCDRLVSAWTQRSGEGAACWLTRPGAPDLHDEDLAWLAAARWAFAAHGVPLLGYWVVARHGWHDPVTGESRRWKRLRVRR